jgi:hypothetical protein
VWSKDLARASHTLLSLKSINLTIRDYDHDIDGGDIDLIS